MACRCRPAPPSRPARACTRHRPPRSHSRGRRARRCAGSRGWFRLLTSCSDAEKTKGGRASPPFERKLTDFDLVTYHVVGGVRKGESPSWPLIKGTPGGRFSRARDRGNACYLGDSVWGRLSLAG